MCVENLCHQRPEQIDSLCGKSRLVAVPTGIDKQDSEVVGRCDGAADLALHCYEGRES